MLKGPSIMIQVYGGFKTISDCADEGIVLYKHLITAKYFPLNQYLCIEGVGQEAK